MRNRYSMAKSFNVAMAETGRAIRPKSQSLRIQPVTKACDSCYLASY